MLRHLIRLGLSAAFSFLAIGALLKIFTDGVGDAERPQVLQVLQQTLLPWVAVFVVVHLLSIIFRTLRYQLLIRAAGEETPRFFPLALVTVVRNMLVDLLPARIGELSYIAMLNRGLRVNAEVCVSSLGLAIVFDILAMLLIAMGIFIWQVLGGNVEGWVLNTLIIMLILSVIGIIAVMWIFPAIVHTQWYVQQTNASGWWGKVAQFFERIADAVERTRRSGLLATVVFYSVLVRLGKYVGMYILFMAVAIPNFPELASKASFAHLFPAFIAAEGTASLPLPTFMAFGTYEAGGLSVLTLFGFSEMESLVSVLSMHIWTQVFDYTLGALAFVLFMFITRKAVTVSTISRWKAWTVAALSGITLLVGAAFAAWQYRATTKLGSLTVPPVGEALVISADDAARRDALLASLDGFIVWSSNRSGNHDIWYMDLATKEAKPLTTHPHTEFFTRVSPNGRYLTFSRAHSEWVSQRNEVPWDIILYDLEKNKERVLVEGASYANWLDDNTITYGKQGGQLWQYDINSGQQEVIFDGGLPRPKGANIRTPNYFPDKGMLFAARHWVTGYGKGFGWAPALYDPEGNITPIHDGCQAFWSPDGSFIYQVYSGEGKQKNAFYRVNPDDFSDFTMILDLPGDYSHEYFPRIEYGGEYMIFSASTGGDQHEHDTADYEVHLWKVGSDASEAVRLTFHSGNDNWPDVYLR